MSLITAVDLFCGAGGMSTGVLQATGRAPLMALNHSPAAILCHRTNHPNTLHMEEDVFKSRVVDVLRKILGRRQQLDLLVMAPDCRHHSRARGGKPVSESVRSLAWAAEEWAKWARPRMILLENVPEFEGWGPPYPSDYPVEKLRDRPIPERRGETFREFVSRLRCHGYRVEWRVLRACDYGAPTTRERLFLIARCDAPIVWPEPTHGPGLQPYRAAAEHLDFNLPTPSIFLTKQEARAWYKKVGQHVGWEGPPKRPLADNTLRRIAAGVYKFVLNDPSPFLLTLTHGGRLRPLDRPLPTITAANRGEMAMVAPLVTRIGQTNGGGRYVYAVDGPLTTITSKNEHLLVAPYLAPYYTQKREGEARGATPRAPLPTVTAEPRFSLVLPTLVANNTGNAPHSARSPLGAITTGGRHQQMAVFLAKHNGGATGQRPTEPLHTVTGADTKAVVATHLTKLYSSARAGAPVDAPLHTITGGGQHIGLVASFLQKFYGSGIGQELESPLDTVTARDRFGLVTVQIDGESYALVDIGMRMLTPEELKRCQGFPEDYELTGNRGDQVAHVGRSVPPQFVEAIVRANLCRDVAMAAK